MSGPDPALHSCFDDCELGVSGEHHCCASLFHESDGRGRGVKVDVRSFSLDKELFWVDLGRGGFQCSSMSSVTSSHMSLLPLSKQESALDRS